MPCFSLPGLKCGPADSNGGSHLPTAWMWNACSPAGSPLASSLSRTPAGACESSTVPTCLPLLSLSTALPDWAAAGSAKPAVNSAVAPTVAKYLKRVITGLLQARAAGNPGSRACRYRHGTTAPGSHGSAADGESRGRNPSCDGCLQCSRGSRVESGPLGAFAQMLDQLPCERRQLAEI